MTCDLPPLDLFPIFNRNEEPFATPSNATGTPANASLASLLPAAAPEYEAGRLDNDTVAAAALAAVVAAVAAVDAVALRELTAPA